MKAKDAAMRKSQKGMDVSLQRLGIDQIVTDNGRSIVPNTKASKKLTCAFCSGNHRITYCEEKSTQSLNSRVYSLSLEDKLQNEEKMLRDYLKVAVPLLVECGKGDVFGRVTDEQRRQSFLLIAASPICGMDLGHVESLNYQLSFIDSRRQPE